jgi:hypothetical protein
MYQWSHAAQINRHCHPFAGQSGDFSPDVGGVGKGKRMRAAEGVGQSGFLHRTTGCKYIDSRDLRGQPFWPNWRTKRKAKGAWELSEIAHPRSGDCSTTFGDRTRCGKSDSACIHSPAKAHLSGFCYKILGHTQDLRNFMRVVAIFSLFTLALLLSGCGSNQTQAQQEAGGVWQASLSGTVSNLSFITQFTVNGDGALSITNFQFLNNAACFPFVNGTNNASPTGSLANLNYNAGNQIVSGNLSFTVTENGNTLTLTSTSITGTLNGTSLTGGEIQGTWTLQGSGSGCGGGSGIFTMAQGSTTTSSSS